MLLLMWKASSLPMLQNALGMVFPIHTRNTWNILIVFVPVYWYVDWVSGTYACCVSLYFGLAYCVPPFLASCTAYRLTTETTIVGVSIYTKWIKWPNVACTCTPFLTNVSFDVFACYIFQFYTSHKRSKCVKNLELFNFVCQFCCVFLWKVDLFKLKNDVCVRYNRKIYAYCLRTHSVLRTV